MMSTEQHGGQARQWPGPPPAAERKAAEVEEDFARDDARTAPDSSDSPDSPEQASASRVDEAPAAGTEAGRKDPPGGPLSAPVAAPATGVPAGTEGGTETGTDARTARTAPGPDPDTSSDVPATLLEPDHSEEFRRRWDAIKASFVDDPQEAVRRAEQLAEEVVAEVARTVDARRRDLIERREGIGDQDDKSRTERLRVVLHGYRGVLDPVLRR